MSNSRDTSDAHPIRLSGDLSRIPPPLPRNNLARLERCAPRGRDHQPIASAGIRHRDGWRRQRRVVEAAAGYTGRSRPELAFPKQGRAADGTKPSLLAIGARDLVTAYIAGFPHDLLIRKIARPSEGTPGALLAIGAMADGVEDRFALDFDRARAATASRYALHAALAFRACATLEAGSRPSATQMSRPAAAIASRSTPWAMPRPFIR